MLFARELTGPLSSLLKQFDAAVTKNKSAELCSFAVFLTDDADVMEKKLKEAVEKEKISENVPLTIVEDVAGPPAYKIDKEAALTVLLYTKGKVVSSYAYRTGQFSEKEAKAIVAQLPKILPSEAELKARTEAEARAKKELEELKKKLEEAKQKEKK